MTDDFQSRPRPLIQPILTRSTSPREDLEHDRKDIPLIGLRAERKRIAAALASRESLLITGPRGAGKTRLLSSFSSGAEAVYVRYCATPHILYSALTTALVRSGHEKALSKLPINITPERWVMHQTSIHLRGILWTALEQQPVPILLDDVSGASHNVLRFFQRIFFAPGISIIAATRNMAELDLLGRLFWDPRRTVAMNALAEEEARELFEAASRHFRIDARNLPDFREKVLKTAKGNPGQIVEMCRLAARPEYVSASGRVKFELVRIDSLMRTVG